MSVWSQSSGIWGSHYLTLRKKGTRKSKENAHLLLFVALDSDRFPRRVSEAFLLPIALVVVVVAFAR
jgi:hypothetical protein